MKKGRKARKAREAAQEAKNRPPVMDDTTGKLLTDAQVNMLIKRAWRKAQEELGK